VHLIADEIAVGMGRTGTMFACEQAPAHQHPGLADSGGSERGITPDFLCLSKGITGGYLPLSVVMTRDEIYQSFYVDEIARGFLHSHSYTGNPLACRAALATLDIFAKDRVLAANLEKTAYMNEIARPLREHGAVRNWRNTGMIWAFELDTPLPDFAQRCFAIALEKGLLLRPIGKTVYFMPPYVISSEEMGMLVNRTLEVIELSGK
jgi:adenosylmethionine-8-amino-7-oxononanoate aminotransferase